MQELALSVQACAAPCVLCWNGWVTDEPILPGRSVGTGARDGNDLARVYLYSWLEHLTQTSIGITLAQWVDDVPIRSAGTECTTRKAIVKAIETSSRMLAEEGLILAAKTTVTATDMELAKSIQKELRRTGTNVGVHAGPPDLGMDIGLGVRRCRSKHLKRGREAKQALKKVRRTFGKHNACRLIMRASVHAKIAYSAGVFGTTVGEAALLRKTQGLSLDGGKKKRCLTTLIAITVGSDQDASFSQLSRQLKLWFAAWAKFEHLRSKVCRAWDGIRAVVESAPPQQRWRQVKGPISGLIHVMMRIGWKLHGPIEWSSPLGRRWTLDMEPTEIAPSDLKELMEEVLKTMLANHVQVSD